MEPSPDRPPDSEAPPVTILAIAFEGALIFVALLAGWIFSVDPVETLRNRPGNLAVQLLAAVWGVAATAPLMALLVVADRFPIGPLQALKRAVDNSVLPLFRDSQLAELALVSFLAGVGEEMLFRGFLQAGVATWIGGRQGQFVGVATASLIFGLCHAITRAYFVAATIMGVYFGLLLLWTDSLLAPILAHGLYDFLALAYLLHWRKR